MLSESAMNPREMIDLLPPYLQYISEDIYRSNMPEWVKSSMSINIARAFAQFCRSVGEGKVDSDKSFFFHNLLWARQHGRLLFVPTDHVSNRAFLKQLHKTLMGNDTDHVPTLNSILDMYGQIILTVNGWREYRL